MAQLIKLENYISRYERDIYHYPGHYIRLKQENWSKLHQFWQEHRTYNSDKNNHGEGEPTNYSKWKSLFNRRVEIDETDEETNHYIPDTLDELKKYYLDSLLPFQLKWASSTVDKMSFVDKSYQRNELLQFFLQRLPDTFLVMFFPSIYTDVFLFVPIIDFYLRLYNLYMMHKAFDVSKSLDGV